MITPRHLDGILTLLSPSELTSWTAEIESFFVDPGSGREATRGKIVCKCGGQNFDLMEGVDINNGSVQVPANLSAKCTACAQMIVIVDESLHGWDSMCAKGDSLELYQKAVDGLETTMQQLQPRMCPACESGPASLALQLNYLVAELDVLDEADREEAFDTYLVYHSCTICSSKVTWRIGSCS